MIKVTIKDRDPNEIMEIVRQMREDGVAQSKDFDFAYYQGHWDEMIGAVPKHTVFTFYNEKIATLFALKYS